MSEPGRPDILVLPPPPLGRPRVKRLRIALILAGLSVLAIVSTAFGMMMAVAADLPELESQRGFQRAQNTLLFDVRNRYLATLADQGRIIVQIEDIAPSMQHAIIAIEDQRFYENEGVDLRGIGRAFWQDVVARGAVQGGSTITQQFVKNATGAQSRRTVLEKLREAALAYHLTRKWPKQKILTEYLNSIYFGNGAYGIESAARTYFGSEPDHLGCGRKERRCAGELKPHEAALLAGIVASPSGFDPIVNPAAAERRRDIVLGKMLEQGYLTRAEHDSGIHQPVPSQTMIRPPQSQAASPSAAYFAAWVRQQVIDRFGARPALLGGLRVQTTLDLGMQRRAEDAIKRWLGSPPWGPHAALVAIDNKSGEVRAMVGGSDYDQVPFNLATQGQRQPGSAFKPFVLATALRRGVSPTSTWVSKRQVFAVPHSTERFTVNNYDDAYAGVTTLALATTHSDNAVFAQVGIKVGTTHIARTAERMGIRTPVSSNYAITLGGLEQGVTPLDMAHAYETFATGGLLVTGTLGSDRRGPVGIRRVTLRDDPDHVLRRNEPRRTRVLPRGVATTTTSILESVVKVGTARAANLGKVRAWGKTGTTENYGDAWFVGATDKLTVAVWVGYPNALRPMETEYRGKPVAGGTYPAQIWRDFMLAIIDAEHQRLQRKCARLEKERKPGEAPPRKCVEEGFTTAPAEGDAARTTTTPTTTTQRETEAEEEPEADADPTATTEQDEAPPAPAPPAPAAPPHPATPLPAPTATAPTVSPDGQSGGAAPQP